MNVLLSHSLLLYGLVGGFLLLLMPALVFLHRVETRGEVLRPGMHGVIGRFGGGKSYFLAWIAWVARRAGREVYANIHIRGCHYWQTVSEFMAIPDGAVILVDEAHLVFPLRVRHLPVEVEERLSHLRHHGQTMFWATQHWTMVNNRVRKLCFTVWLCVARRGGHVYTQFDGATFPLSGRFPRSRKGAAGRGEHLTRKRVRRTAAIMGSYDTTEDVVGSDEWAGFVGRGGGSRVRAGVVRDL